MIDLGNGQYQITNKTTGEKKVVTAADLPKYGIIVKSSTTPTTSQTPKETTFGEKLRNVPLIGNTLSTLSTIASGQLGKAGTDAMEKVTMDKQNKARELAIAARNEMDPNTKKEMLAESKRLSQEASSEMEKFANLVKGGMIDYGTTESPTSIGDYAKTYGRQGLATGVELGTLISPAVTGITGAATSFGGKVGSAALAGGVTGGLYGATKDVNATAGERLTSGLTGAVAGAAIAGSVSAASQGIQALAKSPTFKKLVGSKGTDKVKLKKAWADLAKESTENKNFDSNQFLDDLKTASNKYSGKEKETFLKYIEKEATDPIANDASVALDIRRNIKPASFIKRTFLGESTKNKFDMAKYTAINNQLKKIPELVKYDKYISTLAKAEKIAKPIIYGKVITKILGNTGTSAVKTLAGD